MDGSSWHAKAELRAMQRQEKKRLLFTKRPVKERLARWLKQTIYRIVRAGAR